MALFLEIHLCFFSSMEIFKKGKNFQNVLKEGIAILHSPSLSKLKNKIINE